MIDEGSILAVASIIAGFGVTVMMFRIQRELQVSDKNWERSENERVRTYIPPADFLVIGAILLALLFGVLPLLGFKESSTNTLHLAAAFSAAATILLAGYVPSILAHYRFLFGLYKPRGYFVCWEVVFVVLTVGSAVVAFCTVLERLAGLPKAS